MDYSLQYWVSTMSFVLLAIYLARLVITGQRTGFISIAGKQWAKGESNFIGTSIFYSVAAVASLAFALLFGSEAWQ